MCVCVCVCVCMLVREYKYFLSPHKHTKKKHIHTCAFYTHNHTCKYIYLNIVYLDSTLNCTLFVYKDILIRKCVFAYCLIFSWCFW